MVEREFLFQKRLLQLFGTARNSTEITKRIQSGLKMGGVVKYKWDTFCQVQTTQVCCYTPRYLIFFEILISVSIQTSGGGALLAIPTPTLTTTLQLPQSALESP